MVKKKITCWEFFECDEKECPSYRSKEQPCWLVSGTLCRKEIQGEFLEKIEMCLECEAFKANIDVDSIQETLKAVSEQLTVSKKMVETRDRELEGVSMELALGLSEVLGALREISSGNPNVKIVESSGIELISMLKRKVNLTAQELSEIVDLSHEFAMGLAEHFDVLHRVSKGDLSARVAGTSQVELLELLKDMTNQTVESVSKEISDRKRAEVAAQTSKEEYRKMSRSLTLGMAEVFDALNEISYGNPHVRIPETSELELIGDLKGLVNITAGNLGEIVDLSHEFAMGLAEHFDVLHRVSKGDLSARVSGDSQVELLQSLKQVTNQMIVNIYKEIAEHQKTGKALRKRTGDLGERVKDLNCLYAISRLVMRPGISFEKLVQEIVELTPGSWHHPEVACARIVLEGQEFRTENFRETVWKQISDIAANGKRVGTLEVCYLEQRPEADEGPFMKEDRNLIDAIAERMGRIIERKQADEEKAKLEAQLIQASKMSSIGEMAAGVAHEINNPIAIILGFAELLLERTPEGSKEFKILKAIERQGDNCKRIVENLLAFSRIPKQSTVETNVADDLKRALSLSMNALLVNMVDLKTEIEEDLPKVNGDGRQLEQVYLNIVNNAVAAMDGGGVLTVSAHRSDNQVSIRFTDTGHGISTRNLIRIFEPFFTTKETGKGTGLGLSVSYGLVKKYGGDIQVESQTGDKGKQPGTTFTVMLPVADAHNHEGNELTVETHHSPQ